MNRIEIAKQAVSIVVGLGTSKIIAGVIANNTNPENLLQKIEITSASVVLGGIIAEASRKYTDAKIEAIASWWTKTKFTSK